MKIILVMVTSVDGKTTKWFDPKLSLWTSNEDKAYFSEITTNAPCIIMGRKTYDAAKATMKLSPRTLRVVMTHDPEKYADQYVERQLEFKNLDIKSLLSDLTNRSHDEVFLLGGETLNSLFLQHKAVDELWLTVEPVLFGKGNGLTGNTRLDEKLRLLKSEVLNKEGSLLLKYQVKK